MASKRVADVSSEYSDAERAASNTEIGRIRKLAKPLSTGRLERDVDALLQSRGVPLDEPSGAKRLGRKGRRAQG